MSALKPTSDTRLEPNEALFQINIAAAAAYTRKLTEQYRQFGVVNKSYTDPSLYRDVDLEIGPDSRAILPVSVLSLPMDYGIRALYLLAGSDREPRTVHVVNRNQAIASSRTYFGRRTPMAVRTGDVLEFFNHDSLTRAKAEVLTLEVPVSDGQPDIDSTYPLPMDLAEEVVARASQVLAAAVAQRPDYTTDGKDGV